MTATGKPNAFPWRPLLADELTDRAGHSIAHVRQALHRPDARALYCRVRKQPQASLGAVEPWAALVFAYGGESADHAEDTARLDGILAEALHHLADGRRLDLYSGWCGLGWVLAHLTEPESGEDDLLALDAAVDTFLARPDLAYRYDLVNGLVGLGVYLLERLPSAAAEHALERLVHRLESISEATADGTVWWTPPSVLPDGRRVAGGYNLGVAHGIPGILGFLALVHEAGLAGDRPRRLLEAAVPWLLDQRLPTATEPCIPRALVPGELPEPCRIAWCYGDLGVAAVLFNVARRLGRPDWEREALGLARHAAKVAPEKAGVVDAGLCHGAAGNAHLFNRLFQASGDPVLKEAALFWYRRTFDFERPEAAFGGFPSYYPTGSDRGWRSDATFLMGAVGVALALLAATTAVEPAWDRLLLLS